MSARVCVCKQLTAPETDKQHYPPLPSILRTLRRSSRVPPGSPSRDQGASAVPRRTSQPAPGCCFCTAGPPGNKKRTAHVNQDPPIARSVVLGVCVCVSLLQTM